jgi:hypothetical protein
MMHPPGVVSEKVPEGTIVNLFSGVLEIRAGARCWTFVISQPLIRCAGR